MIFLSRAILLFKTVVQTPAMEKYGVDDRPNGPDFVWEDIQNYRWQDDFQGHFGSCYGVVLFRKILAVIDDRPGFHIKCRATKSTQWLRSCNYLGEVDAKLKTWRLLIKQSGILEMPNKRWQKWWTIDGAIDGGRVLNCNLWGYWTRTRG